MIFKIELINYYKKNEDYERALKVTNDAISITDKNTIPYLNILYKQTELYADIEDYLSAISNYKEAKGSPIYDSISAERKMIWDELYSRIIEESKN